MDGGAVRWTGGVEMLTRDEMLALAGQARSVDEVWPLVEALRARGYRLELRDVGDAYQARFIVPEPDGAPMLRLGTWVADARAPRAILAAALVLAERS
jgi:hypothetical protein